MKDERQMFAVGEIKEETGGLVATIQKEYVPAMKYLSMFSHATLVLGDGGDTPFMARVVALEAVDEKTGTLCLAPGCGLADGNVLYDIKPYMPCEDRVTDSHTPQEDYLLAPALPGGRQEIALRDMGSICKIQGRYYLCPEDFKQLAESIKGYSYLKVFWWFSRFDKKEYRRVTQGEPPYENAPRSGVYATRSPVRPNPIALTVAKVIHVDEKARRIEVEGLDCFDNTPLIAIEPYVAERDAVDGSTVPEWLAHWPAHKAFGEATGGDVVLEDDDLMDRLLGVDAPPPDTTAFYAEKEAAPQQEDSITVRGARQNNLQNVDVAIPKGQITAIAGVSGSGKSSLAFDTLYAESRLRLAESADGLAKPDVDGIAGLPPAVAIAQRAIGRNPRSTVGTFTGIQDRLRLLYAAIGHRHCPGCGKRVHPQTEDELADLLRRLGGHRLEICPHGRATFETVPAGEGTDWLAVVKQALAAGKGAFTLRVNGEETLLQTRQMCYACNTILFELTPATFSFNNPESMCPACNGLGEMVDIDPALVVARPHLSLLDGASDYWASLRDFIEKPTANWMRGELLALAESRGVSLDTPWCDLPEDFRHTALHGSGQEEVSWSYVHPKNGRSGTITRPVEGAIPILTRLLKKGGTAAQRISQQFARPMPCPACQGERLAREGRMVTVGGLRFPKAARMTAAQLLAWLEALPGQLSGHDAAIGKPVLQEMHRKLAQLQKVGLSYLALDRTLPTLSGGEVQRLKLVAQMGLGLSGLLYVMDEPTAGLHPRDYGSILYALRQLKAEGNTVLMVEHEAAMLAGADHLIEMGPGAGQHGGRIVWQGPADAVKSANTETGRFLSDQERVQIERPALPPEKDWVGVKGARGNNLQNISVTFPKGRITCVTGVSGSGKSTLAAKVIAPAIENLAAKRPAGPLCEEITGAGGIKGVVHASQAPIGRSSRSTIATYMSLLDDIRPLLAATVQAKAGKLTPSAFSHNSKDGQCSTCKGEGTQTIAVPFSADIQVVCPVCAGRRYKKEVLAVQYQGAGIHDMLEMPVEEALIFFEGHEKLAATLGVLAEVGLGYLKLGQSTGTLSGGEAQRVKLARALTEKKTGNLLYVLDEPTAGLHFSDIQNLLQLLARLAGDGHTVLVVEHNRTLIQNADWVIDLGPEGGVAGGQVMVQGTPQQICECAASYTGRHLTLTPCPGLE